MLAHRFRHAALRLCKVQKFCDRRHVDAIRAGSAVTAVHAVPFPTDFREGRKHRGVVALLLRRIFVIQRRFELFARVRADHDGRRRGAGERVVDALRHGERLARGRIVGEQIAAAERLHHRDTHAHALAGFVQLLTGGVEVEQRLFIAFLVEQLFHILVAGEKVVAGIDGEHEYLDESALDRLERNERVVAAHAYVQNFALRLQLLRIFHDLPFRDFLLPRFLSMVSKEGTISRMSRVALYCPFCHAVHRCA